MAIFCGNAHFPLPCSLVSTSTYHTVGQGLSFDGSLAQDGADGYELTGNAFPIDPVPENIAYLKKARFASWFLCFVIRKCNDN